MKILIVSPYFAPAGGFGGPVESIRGQVFGLKRRGVDVRVLSTDADGEKSVCIPRPGWSLLDEVKIHYAHCWGFSKPSTGGRFFFAPAMVPQLLKLLPDVDLVQIHGIWVFSTLVGSRAARSFGKPYILVTHGTLFPWALEYKSFKKGVYTTLFENNTLRNASMVQFTSPLERRHAERAFPGLPGVVIPNTVRPVPFLPDGRKFRGKIGVGDNAKLVLFLGRLHVVKGLDLLVKAAGEVIREIPGTCFAFVGNDEGGYGDVIKSMIRRAGLERQVLLTGPVQGGEKWDALGAADVFAFPSHQENFGLSAAEAMACGIPIVTSNTVGIAEDIAEAGAGHVVDRTPENFSRAIVSLLNDVDMRRRMGEAGRKLVARKYSMEYVSKSLMESFSGLIKKHSAKRISRRS